MFVNQHRFAIKPIQLLVLSGLFSISFVTQADQRIGLVKTVSPSAQAVRSGKTLDLLVGGEIFLGDAIQTNSDGAVGITFNDGAVMTIGPNSKLSLDDYLFDPLHKVSFISRIVEGSVSFISGAIGRISPESVQFKTPTATLGLRGTKVLINVD